jgi:hypothetical protein
MIAQVDEQQSTVIANAVTPARQADGCPDIAGAQRAAGGSAVSMHYLQSLTVGDGRAANTHGAIKFVKTPT